MKKNLFDLTNKIAVVTGGTGYLGTSICEALSENGAEVYLTSKNLEKSKKISKNIQQKTRGNVYGFSLDILSTKSIKKCFNQIAKKSGKIDVLVNNAYSSSTGNLEDVTELELKSGLDGTINGVFRCTKEVIPFMTKTNNSSIINISSIYGVVSPDPSIYPGTNLFSSPQYGAGKAGIIQFTKYAACYLAKKRIRVNAITPGAFPNPKIQRNKNFIKNLKKKIPMNRIGQNHEINGAVIFLASDASSYVTGTNIPVDGGWLAW